MNSATEVPDTGKGKEYDCARAIFSDEDANKEHKPTSSVQDQEQSPGKDSSTPHSKDTSDSGSDGSDESIAVADLAVRKSGRSHWMRSNNIGSGWDVVDYPFAVPDTPMPYTWTDLLITLVGTVLYLVDVGSDLYVAYRHFHNGSWWWFSLTLAFVVVPSLIITGFSLVWYYQDHMQSKERNEDKNVDVSCATWVSRFVFHTLQLGPVIRNTEMIIYGWRSRPEDDELKSYWYSMMWCERKYSCLLKLIGTFMGNAPQFVLQLYIIGRFGAENDTLLLIGQILSCVTSLCSMAVCLVTCHKTLRQDRDGRSGLSYIALFLMFLWHVFIIASRVLALALFTAQFTYWVAVLAGAHFMIMLLLTVWLRRQSGQSEESSNVNERSDKCERLFNVMMIALYMFTYINLQEGHTRLYYICYYAIVYCENCIMIVTWYVFSDTEMKWYVLGAILLVIVGFLIGVAFQLIYYYCAHPNNSTQEQSQQSPQRIQLCLSCNEMLNRPV